MTMKAQSGNLFERGAALESPLQVQRGRCHYLLSRTQFAAREVVIGPAAGHAHSPQNDE